MLNIVNKLASVAFSHPFWSQFTAILLIATVQLLLDKPVTLLLKKFGIDSPPSDLVTILSLGISASIVILFYLLIDISRNRKLLLPYQSGLSKIYQNFGSAKSEIKHCILNEKNPPQELSILIHAASNLICGNGSVLGDCLEELSKRPLSMQPRKVKVLYPSLSSPYYSDPNYILERANSRWKDQNNDPRWSRDEYIARLIENFRRGVQGIHSALDEFVQEGLVNLEVKEHDEPYLWNLIIIDGKVFVQGDIYKKALWTAPIMLFEEAVPRTNTNSSSWGLGDSQTRTYYYTFKKYFNDIWLYKSRDITQTIIGSIEN